MQSQTKCHIDFSTIPANVPSMCIPRVFSNIPDVMIRKTFEELCLGEIGQIKRIPTKDDKYKCVRIVFNKWYTNDNANLSRERLLNGKEIKVIYDEPWFWKVYAYKSNNSKKQAQTQTSIPIAPTLGIVLAPALSETYYVCDNRVQPKSIASGFSSKNSAFIKPQQHKERQYRERQHTRDYNNSQQEPVYKRRFEPRSPSNSPPRQRPEPRYYEEEPSYKRHFQPRSPSNSPPRQRPEPRYYEEEPIEQSTEDEHELRQIENDPQEVKEECCYVEVDYGDVQMPPKRKFKWDK
jgi:hypothetical protein